MVEHSPGPFASNRAADDALPNDLREFDVAGPEAANARLDDSPALAPHEREQLARDIADIESAAAVLRKAEPALESWPNPPTETIGKPRPVWLLVGFLWISTAIVTVGAAVAIAALVG